MQVVCLKLLGHTRAWNGIRQLSLLHIWQCFRVFRPLDRIWQSRQRAILHGRSQSWQPRQILRRRRRQTFRLCRIRYITWQGRRAQCSRRIRNWRSWCRAWLCGAHRRTRKLGSFKCRRGCRRADRRTGKLGPVNWAVSHLTRRRARMAGPRNPTKTAWPWTRRWT